MNLLGISFPELVMVGIIALAVLIPAWRIAGKTGFSPWLGLLILVLVANLLLAYYLAFADWPALRENYRR